MIRGCGGIGAWGAKRPDVGRTILRMVFAPFAKDAASFVHGVVFLVKGAAAFVNDVPPFQKDVESFVKDGALIANEVASFVHDVVSFRKDGVSLNPGLPSSGAVTVAVRLCGRDGEGVRDGKRAWANLGNAGIMADAGCRARSERGGVGGVVD